VDEPVPISPQEYGQALDVALDEPTSDGVLVFTLKAALAEQKLAATKARFCADG
jgi:hypothetical protein